MEIKAQTLGGKEQTDHQAELRKLKEEERNEEAQAEKLASRSEALKGEYSQESESLVKQLEIQLMAERENMRLHQARLNHEAAAYKA